MVWPKIPSKAKMEEMRDEIGIESRFQDWTTDSLEYHSEILREENKEIRNLRKHVATCATPIIAIDGFAILIVSRLNFESVPDIFSMCVLIGSIFLLFSLFFLTLTVTGGPVTRKFLTITARGYCEEWEDKNIENKKDLLRYLAADYIRMINHNRYVVDFRFAYLKWGSRLSIIGFVLIAIFYLYPIFIDIGTMIYP